MGKFIVIDTETGGVTPDKSLLQFYAAIVDDKTLEILSDIYMNIKPDDGIYHVDQKALDINKIDLEEHNKRAIYEKRASKMLEGFLSEATHDFLDPNEKFIVVGWNISFDLSFVFKHLLTKEQWEKFVSYRVLDLQSVAAFLQYSGEITSDIKGLGNFAKFLGIKPKNLHDARGDVIVTIEVFKELKVLTQFKEFKGSVFMKAFKFVRAFVRWMRNLLR